MDVWKYWKEENDAAEERYQLAMERVCAILKEETAAEPYREYFRQVSGFVQLLKETAEAIQAGWLDTASLGELEEMNYRLYRDILPEHYEESYGNPAYAAAKLGKDFGPMLSFLYSELRSQLPNIYEGWLR